MYQSRDKYASHRREARTLSRFTHKARYIEVPSWLALLCVACLALALSGCITARQPYGLDNRAIAQVAGKQAVDPVHTSALPAQGAWTPHFYPGTGVKPGSPEPQSAPFTPKGIGSSAGMPPKPTVAPVDLPAPPLPLPESTAAPSSTLFGRSSIGRQSGFNNRGVNFGGTALGQAPKFNQPVPSSGLKVFPNSAPSTPAGFKVANNGALAAPTARPIPFPQAANGFAYNSPRATPSVVQPKPYPQIGRNMNIAPNQQYGFQQREVRPPAVIAQPRARVQNAPARLIPPPPPPVNVPQNSAQNISVFNQPVQAARSGPAANGFGPTFQMSSNMSAYGKRPVPKGANLIVTGNGYQVDTGDELNIRVLGERDLTGRYLVDSTGAITMPMISTVNVRGRTVSQISNIIQNRLKQGFLRTPSVSVEVISSRPFYILGQVKSPGKYNFVNGLTVSQAIAIAGGYEARARKGMVRVTRQTPQGPITAQVPNEEPLMPGDTIYVKQRWF